MARKKQVVADTPPQPPITNEESAPQSTTTEPDSPSPLRAAVRPLPDAEWSTLVTEMHDYLSQHNTLIERSLMKNQQEAEKFKVYRKPVRSSAQTKSGIVLRDDVPAQPTPPAEEHINLTEFYRNGRVKRKK